jgi:hypothetical protein
VNTKPVATRSSPVDSRMSDKSAIPFSTAPAVPSLRAAYHVIPSEAEQSPRQ